MPLDHPLALTTIIDGGSRRRLVRRWVRRAFYETKGTAGKTLINHCLIDRWPAQSAFVFPTVIKITKYLVS